MRKRPPITPGFRNWPPPSGSNTGPSSAGRCWTTRIPAPHPPHGPRPSTTAAPAPNWSGRGGLPGPLYGGPSSCESPIFSECVISTTGGHMGPPLRSYTDAVHKRILRCFHRIPPSFCPTGGIQMIKCVESLLPILPILRRGGPMCPPSGNTVWFPPIFGKFVVPTTKGIKNRRFLNSKQNPKTGEPLDWGSPVFCMHMDCGEVWLTLFHDSAVGGGTVAASPDRGCLPGFGRRPRPGWPCGLRCCLLPFSPGPPGRPETRRWR